MRILIVDDFSTMRRIMKKFLNDLGYMDVTEAEDGATALTILKQGNIDFLVTDWNMPGMPGIDLLKAARADPALANLRVLMVTAEDKRQQIVEAIHAGVNGYLDRLAVNQVGKFEQGLLAHMRNAGKAVLDAIRTEKALSDDLRGKLKAEIDAFAKTFA